MSLSRTLGAVSLSGLLASSAWAQSPELPTAPYLPLDMALTAANAAMEACEAQGLRVTVAVVERSGVTKVVLRSDNAGPHTVGSATGKAFASASLGRDTAGVAASIAGNAELEGLRNMDPRLVLLAGGLPIRIGEAVVGGVGVGGAPSGTEDEACARAGVEAIGGTLE